MELTIALGVLALIIGLTVGYQMMLAQPAKAKPEDQPVTPTAPNWKDSPAIPKAKAELVQAETPATGSDGTAWRPGSAFHGQPIRPPAPRQRTEQKASRPSSTSRPSRSTREDQDSSQDFLNPANPFSPLSPLNPANQYTAEPARSYDAPSYSPPEPSRSSWADAGSSGASTGYSSGSSSSSDYGSSSSSSSYDSGSSSSSYDSGSSSSDSGSW